MKKIGAFLATFLTGVCLSADYSTPKPGSSLRAEVLDALRPRIEKEVGQEVLFKIDQLRVSPEFAFIAAQPLTKGHKPIDYSKTKFAENVREGFFDDWLCALLKKRHGKWEVLVVEIGATDVPYIPWPETYGVPKEIILGAQ